MIICYCSEITCSVILGPDNGYRQNNDDYRIAMLPMQQLQPNTGSKYLNATLKLQKMLAHICPVLQSPHFIVSTIA